MDDAYARFQADMAGAGQAHAGIPPPPNMAHQMPYMSSHGYPPPPPGMFMSPTMPGMPPAPYLPPPPPQASGMPVPSVGGAAGGPSRTGGTIASIRASQGLALSGPPRPGAPDPSAAGRGAGGKGDKRGKGQKRHQEETGVLRSIAGREWRDPSLEEWPENDFRIFVGNLGNEVNDDALGKVFAKYPSFAKAKIVKDKRTKKSKGYGFVSFTDSVHGVQALKEMDGKYIGNRPVKLRKSNWDDRNGDEPPSKKHRP